MADSQATLKIVIADDPSAPKPAGRPAVGTEPAGTAREAAGGGSKPPAGGTAGRPADEKFAELAKALGLTAKELREKAHEPGIRELIDQLPKADAGAAREQAQRGERGTGREAAEKPDVNPINEAIDEVFERFRMGLLSLEEAQARLDRFAKSEKVVDQLRDQFGPGTNPPELFEKLLKEEGAKREAPTRAKPAEVEIVGDGGPTAGEKGLLDALGEFKPLLEQIPGVGRMFALLDKAAPLLGRAAGLTGGSAAGPLPVAPRVNAAGDVVAGEGAEAGAGAAAAGEGAAAAGGLAGLAAAAGPAALGLIGLKLQADAEAAAVNKLREGVEFAGGEMQRVAGNEYLGAVADGSEKAAKALDEIPIVGKVAAAEIRAAAAVVTEFGKTVDAFVTRGRALAAYDARLAAASAQADVRKLQADIREAEVLGDEIGRLTDAQSRIETNFRELFLPVKELLAEILADVGEGVADITELLKAFRPLIQAGSQVGKFIAKLESSEVFAVIRLLDFVLNSRWIKNLIGSPQQQDVLALNAIMQEFLDAGQYLRGGLTAPDPTAVAAQQRLGIPLLAD